MKQPTHDKRSSETTLRCETGTPGYREISVLHRPTESMWQAASLSSRGSKHIEVEAQKSIEIEMENKKQRLVHPIDRGCCQATRAKGSRELSRNPRATPL